MDRIPKGYLLVSLTIGGDYVTSYNSAGVLVTSAPYKLSILTINQHYTEVNMSQQIAHFKALVSSIKRDEKNLNEANDKLNDLKSTLISRIEQQFFQRFGVFNQNTSIKYSSSQYSFIVLHKHYSSVLPKLLHRPVEGFTIHNISYVMPEEDADHFVITYKWIP